jgi:hypothetical protein
VIEQWFTIAVWLTHTKVDNEAFLAFIDGSVTLPMSSRSSDLSSWTRVRILVFASLVSSHEICPMGDQDGMLRLLESIVVGKSPRKARSVVGYPIWLDSRALFSSPRVRNDDLLQSC